MTTSDALDLDTTTGDASTGDADLAPNCECPNGVALVGVLDDLADIGTEPAAIGPAVALAIAWVLWRRKRKPQGAR